MTHQVSVGTRRAARTVIVVVARFVVAGAVYSVSAVSLSSTEEMSMTRLPLWAVLASTAVVAWLLRLLRQPIDTLADLIVYGGRGSGYSEARELVGRMASSLPVDEVLPQLAATIGHITRTPRAEVRFWLAADQRWRQVWPDMATPKGDPLTVGVRHLGTTIGEIEVDQVDGPLDDIGRRRLGGMAGPVGAALATVRLTYALRLRRTELEQLTAAIDASTRRLLGARQAEQRRFRDELEAKVLPLHRRRAGCSFGGRGRGPVRRRTRCGARDLPGRVPTPACRRRAPRMSAGLGRHHTGCHTSPGR